MYSVLGQEVKDCDFNIEVEKISQNNDVTIFCNMIYTGDYGLYIQRPVLGKNIDFIIEKSGQPYFKSSSLESESGDYVIRYVYFEINQGFDWNFTLYNSEIIFSPGTYTIQLNYHTYLFYFDDLAVRGSMKSNTISFTIE